MVEESIPVLSQHKRNSRDTVDKIRHRWNTIQWLMEWYAEKASQYRFCHLNRFSKLVYGILIFRCIIFGLASTCITEQVVTITNKSVQRTRDLIVSMTYRIQWSLTSTDWGLKRSSSLSFDALVCGCWRSWYLQIMVDHLLLPAREKKHHQWTTLRSERHLILRPYSP